MVESRTALPLGVHAVAEARHFVAARLREWELDDDVIGAVTLVASELVTNAVLYGHGAGTLALVRETGTETQTGTGETVRVEVSDRSSALPTARRADDDSEIGRGLHIIEACSIDWGVRPVGDGKVVWSRLAATSVPPVARDLVQRRR